MASKKEQTQLTLSEIAAAKKRLEEESKALEEQLAAQKERAFMDLNTKVDEFNAAFGTSFKLSSGRAVGTGAKRNCAKCHQPGHRSKNCPNVTQQQAA